MLPVFSAQKQTECCHAISLMLPHCSQNFSPTAAAPHSTWTFKRLIPQITLRLRHTFTCKAPHPFFQHLGLAFSCSRWHGWVKNLEPLNSWFSQTKKKKKMFTGSRCAYDDGQMRNDVNGWCLHSSSAWKATKGYAMSDWMNKRKVQRKVGTTRMGTGITVCTGATVASNKPAMMVRLHVNLHCSCLRFTSAA